MPSGKLLLARVTIVDENQKSSPPAKDTCNAIHPGERKQRGFDALALLRAHAVAIEKLFLGRRERHKALHKSFAVDPNPHGSSIIDHFHRKRVEELIAKDDGVLAGAARGLFQ